MSQSRKMLVDLLQEALDKKPEEKRQFFDKARFVLATRAFNSFQYVPLADPAFIAGAAQEYLRLLKMSDAQLRQTDAGIYIRNLSDRLQVKQWTLSVVHYACTNLLESNGTLKKKLLNYLHWDSNAQCFIRHRISDIVSSYVAILIQNIILHANNKLMEEKMNVVGKPYLAMTKLMNHYYGEWVRDEVDKNYSVGAFRAAEERAVDFATWIDEQKYLSPFKLRRIVQRLITGDFRVNPSKGQEVLRQDRVAFWLEVATRCAADKKLLMTIWSAGATNFKPLAKLSEYQRDQYRYCCELYLRYKSEKLQSTKIILAKLVAQEKLNRTKELENMRLKEFEYARITAVSEIKKLTEDRLPPEFKSDQWDELDDFVFVSKDVAVSPQHAPAANSRYSLFSQVAGRLSDVATGLVYPKFGSRKRRAV